MNGENEGIYKSGILGIRASEEGVFPQFKLLLTNCSTANTHTRNNSHREVQTYPPDAAYTVPGLLRFLDSSPLPRSTIPESSLVVFRERQRVAGGKEREEEEDLKKPIDELLDKGPLGQSLERIIDSSLLPWWRKAFDSTGINQHSPCMKEMEQGARLSFASHYVDAEDQEKAVKAQTQQARRVHRCLRQPENKKFWDPIFKAVNSEKP